MEARSSSLPASISIDFPVEVREHLYTCHMDPHQCLRCQKSTLSQFELESHLKAPNTCAPRERLDSQTFGRDVEDQLRRRSSKGKPSEEKWTEIYNTLFLTRKKCHHLSTIRSRWPNIVNTPEKDYPRCSTESWGKYSLLNHR
ncbi:hypothetical protein B0J12DRAFT_165030 [Macrophomina phaseolina]|uniref:Uncharacterized protein n=1 Tax=Macrophomina phaseolina TaxID=35725 RepID=A0ABQ8GS31_9PEZI|nr:hypothetical protein B0J12DRAFT_165030 [Macrophomina phaseolina]